MNSGLVVGLKIVAAVLLGIVPTGLYLYVEPRGRRAWTRAGDTPSTRRAPRLVRMAAWSSFLVGELAVLWLAVPVVCAVLLYLQAKLGLWRPVGLASTALVGGLALVQAIVAMRLFPSGVRLLMRDAAACANTDAWARQLGATNASILGGALALDWAVRMVPGFVHPWLGSVLVWAALRPVMMFSAACLVQTCLLVKSSTSIAAMNTAANGAAPGPSDERTKP